MAPATFQDHYLALGIQPTAQPDEIKKAYRLLAMKHHPDKNKGEKAATLTFQKVSTLTDY
jgi:curved DNA-binding protein CbpA